MLVKLFEHLDAAYPLSFESKRYLSAHLKKQRVARGRYLLRAGECCRHIGFVGQGTLRGFIRHGSEDITCRLMKEGSLCISPLSLLTHQPSEETIRAVEDSVVYQIVLEDIAADDKVCANLRTCLNALFLHEWVQAESSLYAIRTRTERERYDMIKSVSPDMDSLRAMHLTSYFALSKKTVERFKWEDAATGQP